MMFKTTNFIANDGFHIYESTSENKRQPAFNNRGKLQLVYIFFFLHRIASVVLVTIFVRIQYFVQAVMLK